MDKKRLEEIKAIQENARKSVIEYRAPSALKNLESRFKQYATDYDAFEGLYQDRYFDKDGKYINQYRGDTSRWHNAISGRRDYFSTEATEMQKTLDLYKDYISEDAYKAYSDYISQTSTSISDIYNVSLSDKRHWSQWDSEDAYNQYLAEQKEYTDLLNYDLEAGKKEIDSLKYERDHYVHPEFADFDPEAEIYKHETTYEAKYAAWNADRIRWQTSGSRAIEAYDAEIREKEQYYKKAENAQNLYKLESVANPDSKLYDPEFKKYAEMGEAFENPSIDSVQGLAGVKEELIQNPVKYTRDYYNSTWARINEGTSQGEQFEKNWGINPLYKQMTDEEYEVYNYYLAKDKKLADKYLEALNDTLVAREGNELGEKYNDMGTAAQILFGIAAGVDNYRQGVKNFFSSEDYIPLTSTQIANQVVAEDMAKKTSTLPDWLGGGTVKTGEYAYGAANTIGNMLPTILASTVIGPIGSSIGGTMGGTAGAIISNSGQIVGSGMMGLSVAGNAYQEMLNLGYDKDQARAYGILVGASEGALQYALGGISSLGGKGASKLSTKMLTKVDNALGRFAIKYGSSILSEITEEELQLFLEPYFKSYIFGLDYDAPSIDEMLDTALITALSTGILEGPGAVSTEVGTYKDGKTIKEDGKVNRLVDLGKTFSADTVAYELAGRVDENTGAYTIGRLLNEVNASLSEQNLADIKNALIEKGVTEGQAETIAKWMNHVVEGGTLTKKQQMALEMNDVLAEVLYGTIIQSNSTVMQRGTLYNQLYGIAESMGVDRSALEETQTNEALGQSATQQMALQSVIDEATNREAVDIRRRANDFNRLSESDLAKIKDFADASRTVIPEANYYDVQKSASNEPSTARIANVEGKVSDTGKTFVKSTDEEVSIKKIASIDKKNKTMKLELSNGRVVDSNDISYGDKNEGVLYESVLQMGYDAHTANAIVHGYATNSPTSVEDYLIGSNEAFNYGWGHIPEKARGGVSYKELTPAEREYAVKLGENARAADDKARGIKATQNQPQAAKKKAKGKYGARLAVDENTLSDRAKESVKALGEVAKALKVNIVVDNLKGNMYGYYNPSTNEIVIDANAGGKGRDTLLFTASHELVHYVRNWSPDKFTILADFLMEQYVAKGENIDALIRAEIDKAYKATRGKVEMTYDQAYEEVVAQAMQSFLTDSNFIERLSALQKKDASLAKKLISKLKEILNNIRAAYQGLDPDGRASEAVKEMGEAANELYAKMEEALIAASEASQTIGSRNLEEFSEAKNTNGEELFQYKAMEADEEAYRQMLKKHGIMSESEINKLFSTVDKALVIIKNNLEVLDYAWEVDIDDRSFSPVKPNSDNLYKVSLDFSTLCRKRILQQVIQTQLQDALNKPISREESIAIRDELMKIQEEGRQIEIACALCYVESARMKSPAQIKKFLKNRDAVIKEFLASKSGGEIKQKIAKAEADARERLGVGNATLKSMPEKAAKQIRAAKKEAKKSYTPTAEEQKIIDAAKSMSVTVFTSPEGLGNLAKNYPVLFDAYTSYVRNATKSKGIEKDTWWRAGDSKSISDTLIANMNRENGLRSQLWSDFQVIHMLDYIAATIELSTRNAKEQAYSKVPDFIELMGNTGVMLNMSLIPMAKFNGELEYDSVEGMAYKKALELREKYHATAGTICIGISNEQIKMLLDDSTIDYVIPYHESGMSKNTRKLMHIPKWDGYEKYQNETNLSRSEALKQAKKYGVTLLSESDENYHKHTSFSEWFDLEEARQIAKQENAFPTDAKLQKKYGVMYGGYMAMQNAANNYLKLCAERGIAPKFSHENANFTEEANYWKLLIDRKMVDNVTGEIIEQQAIKPIFDESEVLRILNDELERYPNVKADQDYATRTVVEKFLSGEMNNRLDADTIAAIMQKPVDNVTTTNIVASEDNVKAQYAEGEMFEEDKYYARQIDKWESLKDTSYITVGMIKENSPLNRIGMTSGNLYFDVSKIKEAMGDHKDHLSKEILKDIPKLLNNPIAIVEYNVGKNMNTANVYGQLYYHGTPITVGIVATLSRGKTVISKVRTVHARRDFATQITDDSILFLGENKKETNRWFQAQGQPVPMRGTKYGFIRSIHDIPQNVNTNQEIPTTDLKAQYIDTDYAPTFYSQMGKVVEGVKQEKLAANSVVNMLRGKGVKAEEIRWSGIVQFLDGKKSVTKQELLDFINGSMLQIGEQSSSNDIDLRYDSSNHAYIHYDSDGNVVDTYTYNNFMGGYVSEESEEIYSNHYEIEDALREEYGEMSSPRWSEYKLEGGSNYREIVFTLPNSSYSNQMMRMHWGDDAEGVLAHARVQDFNINGKKMLFVEELQSDYHNEGHQSGYIDSQSEAKIDELKVIAEEKFFALEDYSTEMTGNAGEWETIEKTAKGAKLLREYRKAQDAYDNAMNEYVKRIPDAPFKDTYHEFVMKRLLRMAADEGYDSIGWTTADIQDKRWDDKQYHEEGKGKSGNLVGYTIEYDQDIPKFLRKYGKQWDAKVGKAMLDTTEVWSMDITDSMKKSVLYDGQAMFQYKDMDSIDNRSLLARSLEGAAKNDIEKTKLKEYQKKIDLINAEEKKLRELRAQIKEISFAKGPRDTKKLKSLQFEANQAANRINVYDKQLLRLEATKPLMDVLQREKDLVRKKMDKERKEAVRRAKEKDMETIREIMDRYTESRKKAIEGRNKTQMRQKIKNVVGELNQLLLKGTKDKHVMIGLQKAVASALDAVNMDTVGADERIAKYDALIAKANDPDVIASLKETRDRIKIQGDNMNERLTALKNAYKEIKNSNDPLIANSHDEVIENKIESVVNSIGDTPLRDMTITQLEDVYDMYKMVLTTIRNSNKTFKMEKAESITSLANNIMGEIYSIAGSKEYTVKALEWVKKQGWNSLKPTQAFELIGSGTFKKVFANVRAGEDAWAVDINEAREYYRERARRYRYDSWDLERQYEFISKTGKPFSLSLEQIMSLYAYSKRKQADLHLEQGGFVFDEAIEVTEKKKGIPVKYKVNTARAYSISKDALTQIVDKLTTEQKAFVDEMQTYLSDVMGEKGNEVSLEMYGVKLFKEKFYFPLKSAKQFMFEQNEVAGEVRIKNSGFSKETVAHANNPVILSNFMDVWAKHVNDMSMYHAFVLPLEDFNRVFNYKTPTNDKLDTESVKMYLQNAYGTQPVEYIKQLLTDLNGGVRVDPNTDIINKGISLFKKGAVFASLSVVIQQPSAMARAFAYIDPKYFVSAMVDLSKHDSVWEECKQYAPVARIKEMGYFDTNMGMQTTEWITAKEYNSFKEKLKGLKDSNYRDEVLSKAPAMADELTWSHIWKAVKRETAATTNLTEGSEEFLKKAGERFTEVIVNTQVYDSVLSRSGLMRSKDTGVKMLTAFMAEPTTSLNMLVNSFVQAKRGNKRFARKIRGAVASSIILNSILVSLVYAARDDDEDETYAEKYLGSLLSELLDGFNPITYIPLIKDLWSIAQGYDIERSDMSIWSKLWESFEELFDEKKSAADKVLDFSGSVATLFGFPLKNITRDAKALLNLTANGFGFEDTTKAGIGYSISDAFRNSIPLMGRFYKEDSKAQKLYDAILDGDSTQIERAKKLFSSQKAIDTAMRTALRENDPRIKEAAEARLNGNISKYKQIATKIIREGNFSQDIIVGAINAEMNNMKSKDSSEGKDNTTLEDSTKEASSIYKTSDINDALEKGDTSTALEVIDDIMQTKIDNYIADGYKKSEAKKKAEASVRSSLTSYWKPLYLEAKANKDLNEVKRIKAILKSTKLYDNVTKTTDDWWVDYKKTKK